MQLTKTSKAWDEIASRQRSLGPRQRAVLLLANGERTLAELDTLMGGSVRALVLELQANGYLTPTATAATPPEEPPGAEASDQFRHGTSAAAARMYLFDMAERLFARAQPETGARLRAMLREASNVAQMVEVARLIVGHIRAASGPERADGVYRRLATMLPPGAMETAVDAA